MSYERIIRFRSFKRLLSRLKLRVVELELKILKLGSEGKLELNLKNIEKDRIIGEKLSINSRRT